MFKIQIKKENQVIHRDHLKGLKKVYKKQIHDIVEDNTNSLQSDGFMQYEINTDSVNYSNVNSTKENNKNNNIEFPQTQDG